LLEQCIQGRQRLRPRILLLCPPLPLLEDEQLAGIRPLLVARGLRLGLAAAIPHRLVVGVAVQAAMERCPAVGAVVAAPGRSGDAEVDFLPACMADLHSSSSCPVCSRGATLPAISAMRQPIKFGNYLLLERIAVGGMAEVFVAKAFGVEGFERLLAIKKI